MDARRIWWPPKSAEYDGQRLRDTRALARVVTVILPPMLLFFAWQDRAVLGITEFLPARVACLAVYVVAGLLVWFTSRRAAVVYAAYGAAIVATNSMASFMLFTVLVHYPAIASHKAMASSTLSLSLIATLLFAGGLRPALPLLAGLPVAALLVGAGLTGLPMHDLWQWLSNPLLALLLVGVLAWSQEASHRREFASRDLASWRARQLGAFIEALTESAVLVARDGTVVMANQPFADRIGVPLDGVLGANLNTLQPPDVAARWRGHLGQVVHAARPLQVEERDGERWFEYSYYPVDKGGGVEFVAVFVKDITAQRQHEHDLAHQARHDALTDLGNRRALHARLGEAIGRAARGYPSSLLFIDLDHFKVVNDRLGHDAGDRALLAVAALLSEEARAQDGVFRLGGDEFAMVVDGAALADAKRVGERICGAARARLGRPPTEGLTFSVGCAAIQTGDTAEALTQRADAAMYQAKLRGRDRVEVESFE